MIQCARIAFGFGGIYDLDEAERIIEAPKDMGMADEVKLPASKPAPPPYSPEDYAKHMVTWRKVIESGKKTTDEVLSIIRAGATLSAAQEAEIRAIKAMQPTGEPKHNAIDVQVKTSTIAVQTAEEFDSQLG